MADASLGSVLHFVSPKSFIRFRAHSWKTKGYFFRNITLIGMSPFLMNVTVTALATVLLFSQWKVFRS